VFSPVPAQMIVSIPQIVSIPNIVAIAKLLASAISLVPHTCGHWISVIRKSRNPIAVINICSAEWT